jgi:pentatricopeptide repeat protein
MDRWIKQGLRKVGPQALDAIEKTFAYIEWMVQLSTNGDKECSIDPLPNIQPSYALNTVLTSSQRAGQVKVALRAFEMLVAYGYEPDVFAYTALIDVTARTGDVEAAIAVR